MNLLKVIFVRGLRLGCRMKTPGIVVIDEGEEEENLVEVCFSPAYEYKLNKGWTLLMGNTRPECFLRCLKFSDKKIRCLKFSDKKIRGLKFLGQNLRGFKSISKFGHIFFKIFIFWKMQI